MPESFHASLPVASLCCRDPEQQDAGDASLGHLARLFDERLERVLVLARHRRDRDRVVDAFLQEQRSDQVRRRPSSSRRTLGAGPACDAGAVGAARGSSSAYRATKPADQGVDQPRAGVLLSDRHPHASPGRSTPWP